MQASLALLHRCAAEHAPQLAYSWRRTCRKQASTAAATACRRFRLHSVQAIAAAGVASRRGADELILEGKVRVNDRVVTELGTQVDLRKDKVGWGCMMLGWVGCMGGVGWGGWVRLGVFGWAVCGAGATLRAMAVRGWATYGVVYRFRKAIRASSGRAPVGLQRAAAGCAAAREGMHFPDPLCPCAPIFRR